MWTRECVFVVGQLSSRAEEELHGYVQTRLACGATGPCRYSDDCVWPGSTIRASAGWGCGGVRGSEPKERTRRHQRAMAEGNRQKSLDFIWSQLRSRQADRAGSAGADVHLRRPGLDGLRLPAQPDQARDALQPAR